MNLSTAHLISHIVKKSQLIKDITPGRMRKGSYFVSRATASHPKATRLISHPKAIYRTFAEFANIPFDVFQAKLPDLQAETQQKFTISFIEEQALVHDRNLHPRAMHNHRGEPVFDLVADAKRLLREDVKNGVHNSMTPSQMQRTRPEYHQFEAVIFKFRIYQEIRRQKFVHYLQLKRDAKLGPG